MSTLLRVFALTLLLCGMAPATRTEILESEVKRLDQLPPVEAEVKGALIYGCKTTADITAYFAQPSEEDATRFIFWKIAVDGDCIRITDSVKIKGYAGKIIGGDGISRCVLKAEVRTVSDRHEFYMGWPIMNLKSALDCRPE